MRKVPASSPGVYFERILKARAHLSYVAGGDIMVRHDDTCAIFPTYAECGPTGAPCDCDPEIEVLFSDGRRGMILADGTLQMLNVQ